MKPCYKTKAGIIYNGNSLDILNSLESESVQCCITSPPYWRLRDYDLSSMIWDGDDNCEHVWGNHQTGRVTGGGDRPPNNKWKSIAPDGNYDSKSIRSFCLKCGAWFGSLGLEPTPELYVNHLVQIFREVKRVLKNDGTIWVNLGDSYWGGKGQSGQAWSTNHTDRNTLNKPYHQISGMKETRPQDGKHETIKPKDLVGIPWMVAFALRNNGWYLRSDIIWHKPNPMPESVTDRPTKAHEYIFLLTKSGKYYYDADAIKEDSLDSESYSGRRARNAGQMNATDPSNYKFHGSVENGKLRAGQTYEKRNKRSVWTINTKPYKEAHFATYPEKLIEPCVLAGTKKGDTIIDPFFGAGTTGVVACKHDRNFIGIELNQDYCKIAVRRIENERKQLKIF